VFAELRAVAARPSNRFIGAPLRRRIAVTDELWYGSFSGQEVWRSPMPKRTRSKDADPERSADRAQAAREKELLDLIDQVEKEHSTDLRPQHESPHDFVERKMREKPKK
jgi:hypothetical protein